MIEPGSVVYLRYPRAFFLNEALGEWIWLERATFSALVIEEIKIDAKNTSALRQYERNQRMLRILYQDPNGTPVYIRADASQLVTKMPR